MPAGNPGANPFSQPDAAAWLPFDRAIRPSEPGAVERCDPFLRDGGARLVADDVPSIVGAARRAGDRSVVGRLGRAQDDLQVGVVVAHHAMETQARRGAETEGEVGSLFATVHPLDEELDLDPLRATSAGHGECQRNLFSSPAADGRAEPGTFEIAERNSSLTTKPAERSALAEEETSGGRLHGQSFESPGATEPMQRMANHEQYPEKDHDTPDPGEGPVGRFVHPERPTSRARLQVDQEGDDDTELEHHTPGGSGRGSFQDQGTTWIISGQAQAHGLGTSSSAVSCSTSRDSTPSGPPREVAGGVDARASASARRGKLVPVDSVAASAAEAIARRHTVQAMGYAD